MEDMAPIKIKKCTIGEGVPKICVPITGKTCEELEASARKAAACPEADLWEWRLDGFAALEDPSKIRSAAGGIRRHIGEKPLLATIRTKSEGGGAAPSPSEYHSLNLMLAKEGLAELTDVEVFFCPEKTSAWIRELKGCGVRVVGSWHSFTGTPGKDAMLVRMDRIQESGADIVKLAAMPRCREDVSRLLAATWEGKKRFPGRPLITMSMSGLGMASRIAGECCGSNITFGSAGAISAPGQFPAAELRRLLEAVHTGEKIILTGFMGSGKTTIGSTLAEGLGCPFYDTDLMIEEREGMSISRLFEAKGEAYFRERETALLAELRGSGGMAVVATGGGLPMREENRTPLRELGLVVFLQVKPETVVERLAGDHTRPLLAGPDPEGQVRALLERRTPVYEAVAKLIIPAD